MAEENTLVWFKNDLRIHDNEMLLKAISDKKPILPVYCFDARLYNNLPLGFEKAGLNRFRFLLESVSALKEKLKSIGGDLLVIYGVPEIEIPKLVNSHNCTNLFAEQEYAPEELTILAEIDSEINKVCVCHYVWGKTLYHIDDIPYEIQEIPLTSKAYRLNTTKKTEIRAPLAAPINISIISPFPDSRFPTEKDTGLKELHTEELFIKGGEDSALERLAYYTFDSKCLTKYRWTRNKSLGMDYSSKFSPFLALGCISPRTINAAVKKYEEKVVKNQSTWWIIFELVWRDFFTFKGMRMGNGMFKTQGFKNKIIEWENDENLFKRWCDGTTGIPFVDAHMRQLNKTGFMSNRGRVNCASFLIHDYKIDWTWGAAYFESKLIDYDVSSNWMNWHYQAFEIWYTNPVNQALKYDARAFIQKFIPELQHFDDNRVYIPWEYSSGEYPVPDQIFSKWSRAINKIKEGL